MLCSLFASFQRSSSSFVGSERAQLVGSPFPDAGSLTGVHPLQNFLHALADACGIAAATTDEALELLHCFLCLEGCGGMFMRDFDGFEGATSSELEILKALCKRKLCCTVGVVWI